MNSLKFGAHKAPNRQECLKAEEGLINMCYRPCLLIAFTKTFFVSDSSDNPLDPLLLLAHVSGSSIICICFHVHDCSTASSLVSKKLVCREVFCKGFNFGTSF